MLLLDYSIDVLSLNETFLTADFNDDDMFMPGYSIFRNDRGGRHGGGVAYVRDSLYVNIVTCSLPCVSSVECICSNKNTNDSNARINFIEQITGLRQIVNEPACVTLVHLLL